MDGMNMEAAKDWPSVLQFGTGDTITEAEVEKRYRLVAKKAHPDTGGSNEAMTQVNLAKQLALAWVAKERERVVLAQKIERQQQIVQHYASQYANSFQSQYMNQQANAFNQQGGNFADSLSGRPILSGQAKASWVRNLFRSR